MNNLEASTAYISYVGILHPCIRCKRQLDTTNLHVKVCKDCRRQKNNETVRKWRQNRKLKGGA